jgi:hypothetical protein
MLLGEPGAEFVQEVFPAISSQRVNRLHALFLVRPLRKDQRLLCAAIDVLRFDLLTRGEGGEVLQAKVDPERGCCFGLRLLDFDAEIGVPAASGILT